MLNIHDPSLVNLNSKIKYPEINNKERQKKKLAKNIIKTTGIVTGLIGIDLFLAKGKLLSGLTRDKITFIQRMEEDIQTILRKDPAAKNKLEVLLCYPGLHALWIHRISHKLHEWKIPVIPRFISNIGRFLTGIEIHPGTKIGKQVFIDHTGAIFGETAEIGNNVEVIGRVVLGGTGKEKGLRHPIVEDNSILCMDSVILGRRKIGKGSIVGANTTIVGDVPENTTMVGNPGRIIRQNGEKVIDPSSNSELHKRILKLEKDK